MKRQTITLPDELAQLVSQEARRRGISVSEVIRGLIQEGLLGTSEHPRAIPWAGILDDPGMVEGRQVEEHLASWADAIDSDR